MANGRFERLVACSSAEPSSGTAHDMIGTRPGFRIHGTALVSVSVTPSVAAVFVLVDMAAEPPASVLVASQDDAGAMNEAGGVVGGGRTLVDGFTFRCPAVGRRPPRKTKTG